MAALMPRLFGNLDDLLEDFPLLGGRMIRIEEYQTDGQHVIRAELPGVDPAKDVRISVEGGVLTIDAERPMAKQERRRSEFRYGALHRSIALPANANEEDIKARYDKGILEVSVPLRVQEPTGRAIPVEAS